MSGLAVWLEDIRCPRGWCRESAFNLETNAAGREFIGGHAILPAKARASPGQAKVTGLFYVTIENGCLAIGPAPNHRKDKYMAEYVAEVIWTRDGQDFLDNRYSRRHILRFDGGIEIP